MKIKIEFFSEKESIICDFGGIPGLGEFISLYPYNLNYRVKSVIHLANSQESYSVIVRVK